ncbi:MAG TPA: response regulator transcription factor [Hyphomicrobiales bacterium]|nr:response regulator transcription factor [Hyphomicrobiales bacterium]
MRQHVPTILVDPNTLFREGLERLLSGSAFRPVAGGAAVGDVVDAVAEDSRPLLFMIGTEQDGDATVKSVLWVREHCPGARVVVLADGYEVEQLTAVLRAGAHSYLLKTMTSEVLLKSLEIVMLGGSVFSSTILPLISTTSASVLPIADVNVPAPVPDILSDREKQILQGLARGESNKAIARRLSITESTVKVHVKTILRKVKVRNRTQAAVWAMSHLVSMSAIAAAGFGLWDPNFMRHVVRIFMLGVLEV